MVHMVFNRLVELITHLVASSFHSLTRMLILKVGSLKSNLCYRGQLYLGQIVVGVCARKI